MWEILTVTSTFASSASFLMAASRSFPNGSESYLYDRRVIFQSCSKAQLFFFSGTEQWHEHPAFSHWDLISSDHQDSKLFKWMIYFAAKTDKQTNKKTRRQFLIQKCFRFTPILHVYAQNTASWQPVYHLQVCEPEWWNTDKFMCKSCLPVYPKDFIIWRKSKEKFASLLTFSACCFRV